MNNQDKSGNFRERLLGDFPIPDRRQWRAEVDRLLKGAPFERKMFTELLEGITIAPLYTADDTRDLPWTEHHPGQAPFVRGARAGGGDSWLVAQELPYPTVEEFNQALVHDLQRGQNAVCLKLDQAGQLGLDPDQAEAGTVGLGGTSLGTLAELAVALDGVDLEATHLDIQSGSAAMPVAAMLIALANRQGLRPGNLRGSLGCDPVCGLARNGVLPGGVDQIHDELALLTNWARAEAPGMATLSAQEMIWHEGGADVVLGLGLVLSSAVNTLRAMEERGITPETAAAHFRFKMVVGTDFFLEIAKLRALRLLWSDILTAAGCTPGDGRVFLHARTSTRCLTVHDPHVNMLRATTMAMSAVLGGVDSLHISPFDEMDSLPDGFSRRIARNVHLILAEECHFGQVLDPAGGSYYVEKLTAEVAEKAWDVFREIEAAGGIVSALTKGLVQDKIRQAARDRRDRLSTRRDILVGTNRYANPEEPQRTPRLPDYAELYRKRSLAMTRQRTAAAPEEHLLTLERLEKIMIAEPAAVFSSLVEAAAEGATLGELTGVLRHEADGDLQVEKVDRRRDAEPFEELRRQVMSLRSKDPRRTRVFCACLGDVARYMPRLDFVRDFFRVGGLEAIADGFFTVPDDAVSAAAAAEAAVVVLVGLDETYEDQAVPLARGLRELPSPPLVILAGKPGRQAAALAEAGVGEFIHARSDVLEVLGRIVGTAEVGS